ncbi:MAG: DMT family transporter [Clostridia bacterium]|nr:DMT family transporter [Clostridia bacterium]
MKKEKIFAITLAILAAILYAINVPFSKILIEQISPTMLAGFLYLGAGIGISIIYLFRFKREDKTKRLSKSDLPYVIGMVVLDVAAPILLMFGIKYGTASSASLLSNFEIVATSLIALLIFKEKISPKLWIAIVIIASASFVLSIDTKEGFQFSLGSLFVLLATICWGFENNCTRKISSKSTYQIVTIKGLLSGAVSIVIALIIGERISNWLYVLYAVLLGFVAYGLSIFSYVRAQNSLGAAKTSAYYAITPFIGTALSFAILPETPNMFYYIALPIMILGTILVIFDTLAKEHLHEHIHFVTHTHDETTHTHEIKHSHEHNHNIFNKKHNNDFDNFIDSEEHKRLHTHY